MTVLTKSTVTKLNDDMIAALEAVAKKHGVSLETKGGKFDENIVQAFARDILAHHMLIVHKEISPVCMHTHDELVTVADEADGQARCDAMAEVMSIPPTWATGLPLAVSGGFSREYSK